MPEYYSYTFTRWARVGGGWKLVWTSNSIWLLRMVTAAGVQGQFLMAFTLSMEVVGNR